MSELDILEEYLKKNGYEYERLDGHPEDDYARHQIIVYKDGERWWDVICQHGSYGYEKGLLEGWRGIFGDGDPEGYLPASDVIARLEVYDG